MSKLAYLAEAGRAARCSVRVCQSSWPAAGCSAARCAIAGRRAFLAGADGDVLHDMMIAHTAIAVNAAACTMPRIVSIVMLSLLCMLICMLDCLHRVFKRKIDLAMKHFVIKLLSKIVVSEALNNIFKVVLLLSSLCKHILWQVKHKLCWQFLICIPLLCANILRIPSNVHYKNLACRCSCFSLFTHLFLFFLFGFLVLVS